MDERTRTDEEKRVGGDEPLPIAERTISNVDAPIPHDHDGFNPPDGGKTAWCQVIAALLLNCIVWGYPSSFGVFQLYYVETLQIPSSQVSWIGSIQIFLTFFICSLSGRLSDAGYARHTVAVGSFLVVFGTFMTSLATEYYQFFLAQGICCGLGGGIAFMPAVSVASSYFKRKRAFALSIAAVGTSVGSLIFPSIVQYLIPQVGFAWAVRCEAFVALVITLAANLLLKPYLPPRKAGPLVEWGAFKELPYCLFAFGGFCNLYVLYFGFFYVNSFARDKIGFTSTDSVSVLLIVNALGIPARPVVGWLADNKFGPINTYMTALTTLGVVIYAWAGVSTRSGLFVWVVFYGLAVGSSQGTYVGALASLTKDPQKMGTRFGMVSTITAFATMCGPPTAGAIIERSGGDYIWAQIWGGSVIICGAVSILACRFVTTGPRLRAKI